MRRVLDVEHVVTLVLLIILFAGLTAARPVQAVAPVVQTISPIVK